MIGMWFEDKIFQDVTCTIIYLMVLQIAFFFFKFVFTLHQNSENNLWKLFSYSCFNKTVNKLCSKYYKRSNICSVKEETL